MTRFLSTRDRFNKNLTAFPFQSSDDRPLPTRNLYALFNDGGHDLFRHGLSEVSPSSIDGGTGMSLGSFRNTADYSPFGVDNGNSAAKEDPVMFGFDLIIRTQESPLFSSVLSDSVNGFFNSKVVPSEEMEARIKVWDDFKKTFFQFFRSSLDTQPLGQSADPDNPANSRFYYYLTKVTGLDGLIEGNTMETLSSFVDYGKDMIKLDFTEDVTLRIGRMAALYKSLYWSRMSGKTMIPENLLRFDCDIIVSEVRNFVRLESIVNKTKSREDFNGDGTKDDILTTDINGLKMLRDNVNRYVYTLYDCQLFFDKMPHGDVIDLATTPAAYEGYSIGFTYKHSTMRVDVFDPFKKEYGVLNNGSYKPLSITPFDRFLDTASPINSTSTIGETTIAAVTPVVIDIVSYDYRFIELVKLNPKAKETSDGMGTDSDGKAKSKTVASGTPDNEPAGPPEPGNDIESAKKDEQYSPNLSNNPRFAPITGASSVSDLKYELNEFEGIIYEEIRGSNKIAYLNKNRLGALDFDTSGENKAASGFFSAFMYESALPGSTFREITTAMREAEVDKYREGQRLVTTTSEGGERVLGWEESQYTGVFKDIGAKMTESEVDKYKEGQRLVTTTSESGERVLGWEESQYTGVFKEKNEALTKSEVDNYKEGGKRLSTISEGGERIFGWEESQYPNKFRENNEAKSKEEIDGINSSKSSSSPSSFKETNLTNTKSQLDSTKSGAPKESWLKSDSPGARFVKRIVNTGIAAANQVIAKRTALLTKTLNKMANEAGYSSMLPPKNIYETDFNGELYLSSKMVRDSFENFVGESISNLFNKAKRPL